jgi:hypothetical protein
MSTYNQILELNPLSLVFLSGFATQLFISLCYKDPQTGYNAIHVIKKHSNKRMEKWQICFNQISMKLFNNNSFDYERVLAENPQNWKKPYYAQSTLLLNHSKAILQSVKRSELSQNTATKVDIWFESIIPIVKESKLWKRFPNGNKNSLNRILLQYKNVSKTKKNYAVEMEEEHGHKEFAHFSPLLLFLRSMFLIIIHQTDECVKTDNIFTEWAFLNALLINELFDIDSYKKKFQGNLDLDEKISNFPCPYIHELDVNELFKLWDRTAQRSKCVPIDKIFMQIVYQINSKTWKYETLSYYEDEDEGQDKSSEDIITDLECSMKKLLHNILNCEKQSRYQEKKRKKQMANEPDCWTCLFLFPLDDNNHTYAN